MLIELSHDEIVEAYKGGHLPKVRSFNAYWGAQPDSNLASVIAAITKHILMLEPLIYPRRRAWRQKNLDLFKRQIEAVITDVIICTLTGDQEGVHLPRNNTALKGKDRYKPDIFSGNLPKVIDLLTYADYLDHVPGLKTTYHDDLGKKRSLALECTVYPGEQLYSLLEVYPVAASDLRRSFGAEPIILKASAESYLRTGKKTGYEDTPDTLRMRDELLRVNHSLSEANISLVEDGPIIHRYLFRIFNNGDFNQGGRLYGGAWLTIPKELRRQGLRINGEATAELDFGQMALRLLYAKSGDALPEGDLYDIPGLDLPRQSIKVLINRALHASTELKAMPKDDGFMNPKCLSYRSAISLIFSKHPPLLKNSYIGLGLELQKVESDILVHILLTLIDEGVTALPIHDAIIVPRSAAELAERVMKESFVLHSGLPAVISVT